MMGTSHAATGLLTGGVTGLLVTSDPVHGLVCGAVGAGAALLPDLDTPGSAVGRSLGWVTEWVAVGVQALSRAVYRGTSTPTERRRPQDGGHRFLTHTLPGCLAFGVLAALISLVPWGAALVVLAMSALGLATVTGAWTFVGTARLRKRVATVTAFVPAAATLLFATGSGPVFWLVGLVVFVGSLTHVLGDWLTPSGVPLAWPFGVRGKRWWMFHAPLTLHTGRSRVETGIAWASTAGLPVVLAVAATAPA
ncbi:metal-dependent hydrolase [Nocardiopsis salina]|uniref:metal-dependent hydrolase n=1 Tax=Nocardiopsis salina TaxID=245836 RepID=UPI00034D07D0|nr:metal-dependent hydrolase [Nocardiopsis salina]